MKKIFAIALASLMMLSALAGCSSAPAGEPAAPGRGGSRLRDPGLRGRAVRGARLRL